MAISFEAEHKAEDKLAFEELPSELNVLLRGQDEKLMLDSDTDRIVLSYLNTLRGKSA
jgi:hypothetical protein